MAWWMCLLWLYGAITFIVDMSMLSYQYRGAAEECLNPVIIYKNCKVNIFGCIMLTIGGHLLCPWITPFYWFHKLCTVGRK